MLLSLKRVDVPQGELIQATGEHGGKLGTAKRNIGKISSSSLDHGVSFFKNLYLDLYTYRSHNNFYCFRQQMSVVVALW